MAKPKPEDTVSRFKIGDEIYEIDADKLTLGEMAEIETRFDTDFSGLHNMQATIALVYLAMRRKDPRTPFSAVADMQIDAIEDAPAPTRPTKTRATSGSPAS